MTTHIQRSALLPYPAQALYDLVNDVASYPQFLPWCSSAEILESTEVLMRASLGVAKGGLRQHFVTRNTLVRSTRYATIGSSNEIAELQAATATRTKNTTPIS